MRSDTPARIPAAVASVVSFSDCSSESRRERATWYSFWRAAAVRLISSRDASLKPLQVLPDLSHGRVVLAVARHELRLLTVHVDVLVAEPRQDWVVDASNGGEAFGVFPSDATTASNFAFASATSPRRPMSLA